MKKLNLHQRQSLSQITGNISAAWFTAGFISPLFVKIESIPRAILSTTASLTAV